MPRSRGNKREVAMLQNLAHADVGRKRAMETWMTPQAPSSAVANSRRSPLPLSGVSELLSTASLRPRQLHNNHEYSASEDEDEYVPVAAGEESDDYSSSSTDEDEPLIVDPPDSQQDEMSSITEESPATTSTPVSSSKNDVGMSGDNILAPWLETKACLEDSPCPKCLGKSGIEESDLCLWKPSLQANAFRHGALADIVISCNLCAYERVICPTIVRNNCQGTGGSNTSTRSGKRNKKYNPNVSKFKAYPINYSIVLLTQLLGGGPDTIAAIFSFLGLAPSYGGYDKWKSLEDTIGTAEQAVAKEVMADNIQSTVKAYQAKAKEKYTQWLGTVQGRKATQPTKIAKMQELLELKDGRIGVRVGMDGAWQRRAIGFGSGNSMSGHNFCVDLLTKRIINTVVYSKQCTTCERWKRSDKPTPIHRCSKNFDGSSKSMEAEASIQHKVDLETKDTGVYIHTLCTDDDSSVRANTKYSLDDIARRDYPDYHGRNKNITDWPYTESTVNGKTTRTYAKDSGHLPLQCYPIHRYITDKNHRVRCIGKFLFSKDLQSKAKTTPIGKMAKEEALKLKKYAGYYLKQDINQQLPFEEFVRRAPCMYLHHFNDHSLCNVQWCKILQSQRTDGIQPTVIPVGYMKRFHHRVTDLKLLEKLQELYAPYLSSESLYQCYHEHDTNKNESLNRKCTAVAPKDKYLSGTKSLEDRIHLVVVTDSVGYEQGLERILAKLQMDLELVAPMIAEWTSRLDNKKEKQSIWRKLPAVKRRRVEATNQAIKAWSVSDKNAAKEGKVYESGSAIGNNIEKAIELIVAGENTGIL